MTSGVLKVGAILALLMASAAGAYAGQSYCRSRTRKRNVLRFPDHCQSFLTQGHAIWACIPSLSQTSRVSVCP